MSGFVAIVHMDGVPVDCELLQRMTDAMAFRGPDAQAIWCRDNVGLGSALLKNTFESANEKQPCTLEGQIWITAEARVDGRQELIASLRAAGQLVERDAPDVELILHSYRAWGKECLQHLIGDFAFVLWDGQRRELLCARDQFGVVPFFYARTHDGLVCSNTLENLLLCPHVSGRVNEQVIGDILVFGMNQEFDTTIYSQIKSLPPAHLMTWSNGALAVRRYWSMPRVGGYLNYPRADDYVDHFNELFQTAVSDRLRTDHIGIMMSGGTDSTSVAAVAKRSLTAHGAPFDLHAYTWVSNNATLDKERALAELVGQHLKIPIDYVTVEDMQWTEKSVKALSLTPMPLSQLRAVALQRASAHSRVMLTGFGGDPALHWDTTHWLRRIQHGQIAEMQTDWQLHHQFHQRRPPYYVQPNVRRWLKRPAWVKDYPSWLQPDFEQRLGLRSRWRKLADNGLNDHTRYDMFSPKWTNILSKDNAGIIGAPIQTRHPFFDLRLVSYLMKVPAIPWFINKHLLRAAMRDLLPEVVRKRPKTNLDESPVRVLVTQRGLPPWADALAQAPELAHYVDRDLLRRNLNAPATLTPSQFQSCWTTLIVADWLKSKISPA